MSERNPLPLSAVNIDDALWSERIETARRVSIDYMWRALNDQIPGVPPSYSMQNMRIAAGLAQGSYAGRPFQDSDLYKWIEAASYSLQTHPDETVRAHIDEAVGLIEKVQRPDGYINTHVMLERLTPWTDLASLHELYCGGHMMEAAVAYRDATGSDRLLNVACRFADCVDRTFGPEPGKRRGYPGHQEIELGLYKLYRATGEERYLRLAKYFLDERGRQPFYYDQEQEERIARGEPPLDYFRNHGEMPFSYQQAHLPVREQKIATGHAVRLVYMCSGMADVGGACDKTLLDAARTLYDNLVDTQMYVIGAIGSMVDGEALTFPYDIPNDRMFTETCASIGLMMASRRLLNLDGSARYADVIERALYNTVLASTSRDGTRFFYTNPMEMWPDRSRLRNDMSEIPAERQGWYVCACCPPNILRTLMSLGQYIYSADAAGLYVNLYIGSSAAFTADGTSVTVSQKSDYPRGGDIAFTVRCGAPAAFTLGLRWPDWCPNVSLRVNGESVDARALCTDGYILLQRTFADGDRIELSLDMAPRFIYCDDRVPYNAGRVAVQRGPLLYCTEQADNGAALWNLSVDPFIPPIEEPADLPAGLSGISVQGRRDILRPARGLLYTAQPPVSEPVHLHFVPYCFWGNRHPGEEMMIWQRVAPIEHPGHPKP